MPSIKFGRVTRGRGKSYRLVRVDGAPDGAVLSASSMTVSGSSVPSKVVFVGRSSGWVLVLPLLDVQQVTTVRLLAEGGEELAKASCRTSPFAVALESKANTALGHADVLSVRNCDVRPSVGAWEVTAERIALSSEEGEVLRGRAELLAPSPDALAGPVDLAVLDSRGLPCTRGGWSCLDDSVERTEEGWHRRTVRFSVRVEPGRPSLVLSLSGAGAAGFSGVDAEDMAALRGRWAREGQPPVGSYMTWFKRTHEPSAAELAAQASRTFPRMPLFSVVVPLFRTPPEYFEEMADSVLGQSYANLELVLVNASPEDGLLAAAVRRRADADERVRVVRLDGNLGISGNTNEGIRAARGDFVCFLDHDDVLAPDALYHYAREINEDPVCDLLYSDEDLLEGFEHVHPYFKPDWSPNLLMGMNYVCHFLCVSRFALERVELAGPEFDGSQDHYLTLAVGEVARSVRHVPRVLYHWRVHPGSTTAGLDVKPYAVEAGRRAVQSHLDRTAPGASVRALVDRPGDPARYELSYASADDALVSVVVPSEGDAGSLARCLESLVRLGGHEGCEVLVAGCGDCAREAVSRLDAALCERLRVRPVTCSDAAGHAAACNRAVAESRGDFVLLLDEDAEVLSEGLVDRMASLARREGAGAVGTKVLGPDGLVRSCGLAMLGHGPVPLGRDADATDPGYYEAYRVMHEVSALDASCLMLPAGVFGELGGLDEGLAYGHDVADLCLRLLATGRSVVVDPGLRTCRHGLRATGEEFRGAWTLRSEGLLLARWASRLAQGDPFYNGNLVASPPRFHVPAE